MSYHKDLSSPCIIEIAGGMKIGHRFTIYGKVSAAHERFSINFQVSNTQGCDIGLHFNPRKNENTVVRNSYNGGWQTEERTIPNFPFNGEEEFKIHVHVTDTAYKVYVNDSFYIEFNHRLNLEDMHYLRMSEGAEYYEVYIEEKTVTPYIRGLPQLSEGMSVRVAGLINTDAYRFSINFDCDTNHETVALHFNPRQDQNDTVLNTFKNGQWGVEQRGFPNFPFTRGEYFTVSFTIHGGAFLVTANGQPLETYAFRVPLENIQFLRIMGDIVLTEVTVFDQLLNDWVKPIHGGLQPEDMVTVEGFFKPGVDRFQVNLLTGTNSSSERAIHVNPRRGQQEVVINSTSGGHWQTEVKYPLPSDLMSAVPFRMDIVNRGSKFLVFLDGKRVGDFPHRLNVSDIQSIYCTADAYFHSIKHTHRLPNPHGLKTVGTAVSGHSGIRVIGVPLDNPDRFAIDAKNGPSLHENAADNILFHYNGRYGQGVTVRNTQTNGVWGQEERDESSFPFEREDMFDVIMILTSDCYKVVANGKHHIDYAHRIPPTEITHVVTRQNAYFYNMDFF